MAREQSVIDTPDNRFVDEDVALHFVDELGEQGFEGRFERASVNVLL